MDFDKVKKEHILQGIKDFEEKGIPPGFKNSTTYNLVYKGKIYPPKIVMVYANKHASGRKIEWYFKGGEGTECFEVLRAEGFSIVKKYDDKLYELKQQFLEKWPLASLENMTLEQYTNLEKNSFCYWLEHETRDLGSIVGGSSYKFGIYKRNDQSAINENSNRKTDGEYAWFDKYGATKEEAFKSVKNTIVSIAKNANNDNLKAIDPLDLGNAYKWKIAFLYGNYNVLNAFKIDALRNIATYLKIEYTKKTPISFFHSEILSKKSIKKDYYQFSHELWRYYQEGIINVQNEFAAWLNQNMPPTYRSYLGDTLDTINARLSEINSFFDEINFFLVNPNNINEFIDSIKYLFSKNQRENNRDFNEYDSKKGSGIPKAILGKENYFKFLKEKFKNESNYWIFQGSPEIYDITNALNAAHLKSWKVAAHKDKIKIGDKVVIWQTGNEAGCYALAKVTSDVGVFEELEYEKHYYKQDYAESDALRVKLKVTDYAAENPILWNTIKNLVEFKDFNAGNQGTNFKATKEEYLKLKELIQLTKNTDKKYWLLSPGRGARMWVEFYKRGEIGLGWDLIGDLSKFADMEEVRKALQDAYGGDGNKMNDTVANWEFGNDMNIGDIVIIKSGRTKLLGYGEITSDYYRDESHAEYKNRRSVSWIKKGKWNVDFSMALKTLTEITKYNTDSPYYDKYYELLIGIMNEEVKEEKLKIANPINQILYGPPGTGKTYKLQNEYFSKYTISETNLTKEQYIENEFNDLNWFQVITLIVLELESATVSQIMEHHFFSIKAKSSSAKNLRAQVWGNLQAHTVEDCENVKYTRRVNPLIFNKDEDGIWTILENELEELFPEAIQMLDDLNNFQPSPSKLVKNYEFITFHQSFSYEDFVEGIKPIMKEGETDLGYEIQSGVFKRLCNRAKADPDNDYAIFIDEINRGNVSAIFGELITLIEKDKRAGAKNALEVQLPYSKEKFSVPINLHIYGTMNTADRSVEALDSALRRRFTFKELMPKSSLLSEITFNGFTLEEVLTTINERIEILVDRDHTIGHSYFLSVNTDDTMALSLVFQDKIIPLLQEYFYHDYEKLALILGSGFVKENSNTSVAFANFKNIELPSIENQFTLRKNIEDIEKAVLLLLNKKIEG